ncbi:hypothetical protein D3C87_1782360 [compost metagenome]
MLYDVTKSAFSVLSSLIVAKFKPALAPNLISWAFTFANPKTVKTASNKIFFIKSVLNYLMPKFKKAKLDEVSKA